jgi:hypothetical protein
VPRRERGLQVDEVSRDLQGAVQVLAAEPMAGLGLAGQYRIPRVELVQPVEEPGCGRQELRDQSGIAPSRATPLLSGRPNATASRSTSAGFDAS